jgi:hypothetical protein
LGAPHLNTVSGTTVARLEQARALVKSGKWDEAIDVFGELAVDKSERVIELHQGRFVNLRTYCNIQLSHLPQEGLAAYRRRADVMAEQWYREGIAQRDELLLRRVVDEAYCSSWGDDALFALGELALERADYADARRNWEQISPLLRSPDGLPMWLALRGVDVQRHWPEVERLWNTGNRPNDLLAYPDTQLDLAEVRAALVLTTVRAGDLDRATIELNIFQLHPNATGPFGGQTQTFVAALERLIAAARELPGPKPDDEWPTFAGSQIRSHVAEALPTTLSPLWSKPVRISPPVYARNARIVSEPTASEVDNGNSAAHEWQRPLSCYPLIFGDNIIFVDGVGIHAVQMATGKPAVTNDGLLYRNEPTRTAAGEGPFGMAGGISYGVPRLTLNLHDAILYSRIGSPATSHMQANKTAGTDSIIGIDLRRDGLLCFRSPRQEPGWSFDGTPVTDGQSVFLAMRQSEVTPHAYVACFDSATGNERWRTSIGSADTPGGGSGGEITHNLLTLVGDRVYLNTNLGLVAALNSENGAVCWISRYERAAGRSFSAGSSAPVHFARDPSPCVYDNGVLLVVPSDTPAIFALHAETGKTVWRQDQVPDGLSVLGIVQNNVVIGGERLGCVDLLSGEIKWVWPESPNAGIRGMGRGIVAGSEVFWPTRNQIHVVDAITGSPTRPPIELEPLAGGANLAAARGCLVLAGYDQLIVLGPSNGPKLSLQKTKVLPK